MPVSAENVAQHMIAMGYSAKAGTIKDKKTGEPQDVVFINGLGQINAYLNLSSDPTKFGLKVFGNLQDGYAPVLVGANGQVVRETVSRDGSIVTRAKRGEPLDAETLKRKNNEISLIARKDITAAALAAYMLEVGGGDLELIRDGFRLQKWERSSPKVTAEGGEVEDITSAPDVSVEFAEAAAQTEPSATSATQERRRTKRGPQQSL